MTELADVLIAFAFGVFLTCVVAKVYLLTHPEGK